MQLISQRLRRRTSAAGGDPLITYYDLSTGERTELSAVTVSNWVDKTCYLLTDEYGLDIGDAVLLDVARTHPGHWVTACLELACWRLGLVAAVDSDGGAASVEDRARLVVAGPVYQASIELATRLGADLLACSLHPLGLPFAERVPEGVADYALEVRGQPDQFSAVPVPTDQLAWVSSEATLTQLELDQTPGSDQRRLLRPSTPWTTARDGIVAAVVGGGSVVLVVGEDAAGLDRIRETENITDAVG